MKIQNIILLLAILSCGIGNAVAQSWTSIIQPSALQTGASLTVYDDEIDHVDPSLGWVSSYVPSNHNVFKATGEVKLFVDKTAKLNITSRRSYDFNLQVEYVGATADIIDKIVDNITLRVEYDPAGGTSYQDIALKPYEDVHWMSVTVSSITDLTNNTTVTNVEDLFKLTGNIEVLRYDVFDASGDLVTPVSGCDPNCAYSVPCALPCDLITITPATIEFELPKYLGAEFIDLEWTWVDPNKIDANGDHYTAGLNDLTFSFENGATRVRIGADRSSYTIANTFRAGYIVFRYRAWGRTTIGTHYTSSEWMPKGKSTGIIATKDFANAFVKEIDQAYAHEIDKNWQFVTSFAEDGKRKEVITYFDGLNKTRQAVTQLPSDGTTIVGQTIYDHEGRPAVQVLPVPIENKTDLNYEPKANQAFGTTDQYSADHFDGQTGATGLSTANGAGRYYSPANTTVQSHKDYIPNAQQADGQGFPFTQTVYTQDQTGRVLFQSGVGPDHKIGSGHETEYQYGKPNHVDLAALFGDEVGKASHYKESIVIDPNGQMSVSYIDQHGRVIATSLSGGDIANMDNLPLKPGTPSWEVHPMHQISRIPDAHPDAYELTYSYIAKEDGDHQFWYEFQPEDYLLTCNGICFDCYYDLEISITAEDGTIVYAETKSFAPMSGVNDNCDPNNVLTMWDDNNGNIDNTTFFKSLTKGKYYIQKKLAINTDHVEEYWDLYAANEGSCLNDYDHFYNIALGQVSDCDDLDELPEDLGSAQCSHFYNLMLADFTPGGAYASVNNETDPLGYYLDEDFKVSIFNENNSLDDYENAFWGGWTKAKWNQPYTDYVDGDGERTKINDGGNLIYPEEYSEFQDLADNWSRSYSGSLVPFHPEFPHFTLMCQLPNIDDLSGFESTFTYDETLLNTTTMAEAIAAGFIDPSNANAIAISDPLVSEMDYTFWSTAVPNADNSPVLPDWTSFYQTTVTDVLINCLNKNQTEKDKDGTITDYDIRELVVKIQCKKARQGDALASWVCEDLDASYFNNSDYYSTEELDEQWQLYVKLYLAKKNEVLFDILDDLVRELFENKSTFPSFPYTNFNIGFFTPFKGATAHFSSWGAFNIGVTNDANETIDITEDANGNDYDDLESDMKEAYDKELLERASSVCTYQVARIIDRIQKCDHLVNNIVNGKDMEDLSEDLMNVCLNSYSPDRLMGSREDDPDGSDIIASPGFTSYADVLTNYFGANYESTYCNLDVFDDEMVSNDHALMLHELKEEKNCACDYLESLVVETIEEERTLIKVENNYLSNLDLIQQMLNDLVVAGFTISPTPASILYTQLGTGSPIYSSVFATHIGVDLTLNPADRIEYRINYIAGDFLRISFRKVGTNNSTNSFTLVLSDWTVSSGTITGSFSDIKKGGKYPCVECTPFNLWYGGSNPSGQLSFKIGSSVDEVEVKEVIESVRDKYHEIKGTSLTNGEVLNLMEACSKIQVLLGELKPSGSLNCTVMKKVPSLKQYLLVQHLNEVAQRQELGGNTNEIGYNCALGPYDYLIDYSYDLYIESLMVGWDPFNNYYWSNSYNQPHFDPNNALTNTFFFGADFETACDGWVEEHCFASLGYLSTNDKNNYPILNPNEVVEITGPHYDYSNDRWLVELKLDDGAGNISYRNMHFESCDDGLEVCVESEWLDLVFKGTCTNNGVGTNVNQMSTDDFDYACDCAIPSFDELLEELYDSDPALNRLFTEAPEVVTTYNALINESSNHLKKYNVNTGSIWEYVLPEPYVVGSEEMKVDFGDLNGDHCRWYIKVPEDGDFGLDEIVAFTDTRLNEEQMDAEAMKGIVKLRYGSAHYIISVDVYNPADPANPLKKEVLLYADCYLTECAVIGTRAQIVPGHIVEQLPCPDCIDCVDLKNEVENFVSAYPEIGYNHALFSGLFTRFLNTAFNTNRAFSEYREYVSNCKLASDALPVYTNCHLSFSLNAIDAAYFDGKLATYEATFSVENDAFIKYSITDNSQTTYDYCFDFSNLSIPLAAELMKKLTQMNISASDKVWDNYPLASVSYTNAQENTGLADKHVIELPIAISGNYESALIALESSYTNLDVTVLSGTYSKSHNGSGNSSYKIIEIDYSTVAQDEYRPLIDDILSTLESTNQATIQLNQMYYGYNNVSHEGYEICEVAVTDCETCETVRDAALNYVYSTEDLVVGEKAFIDNLERSIKGALDIDVIVTRATDDCETCTDRDLYVCDELSTEANDMLVWMNDMAGLGLTTNTSLSTNNVFLNASFYPNSSTDNPAYAAVVNTGGTQITMTATDALGFAINVVVYTRNGNTIDFSKVSSFDAISLDANTRGGNYHFKGYAHNSFDSESYAIEGYVDAFPLAACCYFDDLELCYRPQLPQIAWEPEDCEGYRHRIASQNAWGMYEEYIEKEKALFAEEYREACAGAFSNGMEKFQMKAPNVSHHYTLYYYDQAGNLVQTVPPKGVNKINLVDATNLADNAHPNTGANHPNHGLNTFYEYNSLNQPVWQSTPDGGESEFFYDKLGRVVFSQNARQATHGFEYSYTVYDPLGRISESGQIQLASQVYQSNFYSSIGPDYHQYLLDNSVSRTEITYIKYDEAYSSTIDAQFGLEGQEHLRNRVSCTYYKEDASNSTYDYATHYSYDLHGLVKTVVQEYPELADLDNDFKRIDYDYDLVSGNVNVAYYQKDEADQFIHRYSYDDDNRIKLVETSRDGHIWDQDAKYEFYMHGSMARTELGDNQVQGLDYAYTLQGRLKGVNAASLETARDPGGDIGNDFARDAFGYNLHYYEGDYQSIGSTSFLPSHGNNSNEYAALDLFNGNISAMTTGNRAFVNDNKDILGQNFKYDQLNRLVESKSFLMDQGAVSTNSWGGIVSANKWSTDYAYDANGNLTDLMRRGHQALPIVMDDFEYHYKSGTNQLTAVDDIAHTASGVTESVQSAYFSESNGGVEDLDHGQDVANGNYTYDETGNLIKDVQEEIETMEWTVQGKVKKITRSSGSVKPELEFEYGASGQRVKKLVKNTGREMDWSYQYYVHGANGEVMAVYEKSLTVDDHAFNYEAIGNWVAAYNSGGTAAVIDLLKAGYDENDAFKDRLITELLNNGLEQTVAGNYTLAQILGWEAALSKDLFAAYANDPSAFNWMMDALLNNSTFKDDFIEGLWIAHGSAILEVLLNNDPPNDFLNCLDPTDLNQLVANLYTGPPPSPSFGTKMDAIVHLKANHTNTEIATELHSAFAALSKTALKSCVNNMLLTSAWTHTSFQLQVGSMGSFFDMVALSLDEDDLAAWFITDPDATLNRASNYLLQNGNPNLLLTTLAANDAANFIAYGMNALPTFAVLYNTLLPGLENHNALSFAFLVKQELGDAAYNSMMDDLADDFEYHETLKVADYPIYGSKRHGSKKEDLKLVETLFTASGVNGDGSLQRNEASATYSATDPMNFNEYERTLGQKQYELSNHLGNVLATVSDRRVLTEKTGDPDPANWYWDADIKTAQDYYPFGMIMPDRNYTATAPSKEELNFEVVYEAGFDSGLDGWQVYAGASLSVSGQKMEMVTDQRFEGATYTFATQPGKVYHLSYTVAASSTNATLTTVLRHNGAEDAKYIQGFATTGEITRTFTFVAEGSTAKIDLLNSATGTYTYTIDNMSLREGEVINQKLELLGSSNFSTSGQMSQVSTYNNATATRTNEALEICITDYWTDEVKYDASVTLEQGADYVIEFDVDMGTTTRAQAYIRDGGAMSHIEMYQSRTYRYHFRAKNTTALEIWFHKVSPSAVNSCFTIDNIKVYKDRTNYSTSTSTTTIDPKYRYAFNGMEMDDEWKSNGNAYDFGLRCYDPRLGRMMRIDPRAGEYPWQTPYAYHRNSPISMIDFLGGGDPPKEGGPGNVEISNEIVTKKEVTAASPKGDLKIDAFVYSGEECSYVDEGCFEDKVTNLTIAVHFATESKVPVTWGEQEKVDVFKSVSYDEESGEVAFQTITTSTVISATYGIFENVTITTERTVEEELWHVTKVKDGSLVLDYGINSSEVITEEKQKFETVEEASNHLNSEQWDAVQASLRNTAWTGGALKGAIKDAGDAFRIDDGSYLDD